MSRRNKLQKFADILSFPNVYESKEATSHWLLGKDGTTTDLKGKWHKEHFKNNNPITLELACGRGEYSVALGALFPQRNFIGVDIKGARIHQGAKQALDKGLDNVAFLRARIEMIDNYFDADEISEIWITFPDPFLKESKANRRLTAVPFLEKYRRFVQKGAFIHLKTDSPVMYDFTLQTLSATEGVSLLYADDDIYSRPLPMPELEVKTYYEVKNIAQSTIRYVRFSLT
jgi:tRNA (guanine-N7-)-methyltransferase